MASQLADQCNVEENRIDDGLDQVGRSLPDMYSADLSLFVLDAGIRLLEQDFPSALLYLSLTDYIQLKYPPDHAEALAYYAALDQRCARLEQLGAIVALVGDHGMTDKCAADGSYNIIYLQDLRDAGGECEVAAADVSVAADCAAVVDIYKLERGPHGEG